LRRLVEIFHHTLRAEDVLARYGGEEFVVLLRGNDSNEATQTAERLRRRVADSDLGVTISAGIAAYPPDDGATETPKTLVARADAALLRAKLAGRNQVAR
jgi:diguanylate cyclase (GGDEF)-like protein